jgi:hypothetical protein
VAATLLTQAPPVWGRDLDGRYRDSPLHNWRAAGGSVALLQMVEDADWETKGGRYRVRVPTAADAADPIWVDVPDETVITEPDKTGRTTVWPLYGLGGVSIRCFMPGSTA